MTHMGFVTTVEQAPAVREAYARASHQFSRESQHTRWTGVVG
jgi:hypothetical protein